MFDIPNYDEVNSIDLSHIAHNVIEDEFRNYFLNCPSSDHYKLLGYFSMKFNNSTLLDIGTFKGCSALALSLNQNNKVVSFDVVSGLRKLSIEPNNIEFIVDDCLNEKYKNLILSSPFIMYDTVHDGKIETDFYNYILSINYKGILMFDDIKYNEEMISFWNSINEEKYDISNIGHWSGTGLVIL